MKTIFWKLSPVILLVLLLSGCGEEHLSTLSPAGKVGEGQLNLLLLSTAIMTFVIIIVFIIYVLAIMKFRRSKVGERIPKQTEGNFTLEVIWTVIPIILLLILAVPTVYYTYQFADTKAMESDDENVVTVNVNAKLYWWEFEYPNQGIVTSQELVVPTGEKVYFNLQSADVKHSFWIPSVGGKMDTNVDNVNKFYLQFDKNSSTLDEGVFYGKCAELCGPSHALMDFKVKTVSQNEFKTWVSKMKKTDQETTEQTAVEQQGEEIFKNNCITCHATSAVGEGTGLAPNLTTFGDRNRIAGVLEHTEGNLKEWIDDPQRIKPANTMPSIDEITDGKGLTDEEMDALATYLMGLSVEK